MDNQKQTKTSQHGAYEVGFSVEYGTDPSYRRFALGIVGIVAMTAIVGMYFLSNAFGQTVTSTSAIATDVGTLVNAAKGSQWTLLAGGIVFLLVKLARQFNVSKLFKLSPSADKWLAIGLALVGGVGFGLQQGGSVWQGLLTGLQAGFGAIGTYQAAKGAGLVKKAES